MCFWLECRTKERDWKLNQYRQYWFFSSSCCGNQSPRGLWLFWISREEKNKKISCCVLHNNISHLPMGSDWMDDRKWAKYSFIIRNIYLIYKKRAFVCVWCLYCCKWNTIFLSQFSFRFVFFFLYSCSRPIITSLPRLKTLFVYGEYSRWTNSHINNFSSSFFFCSLFLCTHFVQSFCLGIYENADE